MASAERRKIDSSREQKTDELDAVLIARAVAAIKAGWVNVSYAVQDKGTTGRLSLLSVGSQSRRTKSTSLLARGAAVALLLSLQCGVTVALPLSVIHLGDSASERVAAVAVKDAPVQSRPTIALGEKARRLVPQSSSGPANIEFDVRVDPSAQNYVSLRLWGSDDTWSPLSLRTSGGRMKLADLWWHVTREAPVPGRFFYRTVPLPLELTRGKPAIRLRIESTPAPEHIGVFRNADAPAPILSHRPSFAIYGIYSHTDPWFDPPSAERQGPAFEWGAPAPKPAGYPASVEERLLERARVDIRRALNHDVTRSIYGVGHRYDTRVLETLPLIFNTPWSGHFQDMAIARRVLAGIDANVKRQMAQGGEPGLMFYRGWGEHGNIAYAYSQMHEVFSAAGWLDEAWPQTPSGSATSGSMPPAATRREAYADFFNAAFEWRQQDRRSWTNQPIYVNESLYRMQRALRLLGDPRALTEAQALRYIHEALGIFPLRSRPFAIAAGNAGYPYHSITRAGLTREKGYVDGYGELSDHVARLAEETGDPAVLEVARRFLHARAVFRVPTQDAAGNAALRGIGAISWRGTTFPFRIAYSGIEEAALLQGDPVALRLAQLEIGHGRLHLLPAAPEQGPHWHPATSIRMVEHYRKVSQMPASAYRLPAEPGQADFVWADPEDGVFVFRHGEELVYGSFFNLDAANARAVGERGIVHRIRGEREQLLEFPVLFGMTDSGLGLDLTYDFGTRRRPQAPPPPGLGPWPVEPPEMTDFRAGRADFYYQQLGPYLIVMNATEPGTYREKSWAFPAQEGLGMVRDLATGEVVDLSQPLKVPPMKTRVFVIERNGK
ncbi:hypothetical protein [Roseateles sp.]|uniref:hypothetical protein n=1 Tax=Roseateles sp. TaxID=1971397 RepID=UPI0039EBDB16